MNNTTDTLWDTYVLCADTFFSLSFFICTQKQFICSEMNLTQHLPSLFYLTIHLPHVIYVIVQLKFQDLKVKYQKYQVLAFFSRRYPRQIYTADCSARRPPSPSPISFPQRSHIVSENENQGIFLLSFSFRVWQQAV